MVVVGAAHVWFGIETTRIRKRRTINIFPAQYASRVLELFGMREQKNVSFSMQNQLGEPIHSGNPHQVLLTGRLLKVTSIW